MSVMLMEDMGGHFYLLEGFKVPECLAATKR